MVIFKKIAFAAVIALGAYEYHVGLPSLGLFTISLAICASIENEANRIVADMRREKSGS